MVAFPKGTPRASGLLPYLLPAATAPAAPTVPPLRVQLWRSDLILTGAQVQVLRAYIDAHLSGCTGKCQSVSHLVRCVRDDTRLAFPTNHGAAMDTFKALGYRLVPGARRYTWNVTAGDAK